MLEIVKSFLKPGEVQQAGLVEGKYYRRTGACNMCGKCCTGIYLVHGKETIASVERFEELQAQESEYASFKPIDVLDDGVIFQCVHLQEDKSCAVYESRPSFCQKYPSEHSLLLGGKLAEGCGYQFHLVQSFQEVLSRVAEKRTIKAGKLIS